MASAGQATAWPWLELALASGEYGRLNDEFGCFNFTEVNCNAQHEWPYTFFALKPWLEPGPSQTKPGSLALALASKIPSQSQTKPSQSHGFRAKPSQQNTSLGLPRMRLWALISTHAAAADADGAGEASGSLGSWMEVLGRRARYSVFWHRGYLRPLLRPPYASVLKPSRSAVDLDLDAYEGAGARMRAISSRRRADLPRDDAADLTPRDDAWWTPWSYIGAEPVLVLVLEGCDGERLDGGGELLARRRRACAMRCSRIRRQARWWSPRIESEALGRQCTSLDAKNARSLILTPPQGLTLEHAVLDPELWRRRSKDGTEDGRGLAKEATRTGRKSLTLGIAGSGAEDGHGCGCEGPKRRRARPDALLLQAALDLD
ncbi:hypothetical protein DFH09DRAFT_1477908 [Mycena vulgaris]|nr:hypothetical protein DFH09DRAFT_1477908 [Mycena vulgaris]